MSKMLHAGVSCILLAACVGSLLCLRGEGRRLGVPPFMRHDSNATGATAALETVRYVCIAESRFDLFASLLTWTVGREKRPETATWPCLSARTPLLHGAELLVAARTASLRESLVLVRFPRGAGELDNLIRASGWTAVAKRPLGQSYAGTYDLAGVRLVAIAWKGSDKSSLALLVIQGDDGKELSSS